MLKALSATDESLKAQLKPLMPFVTDRDRPYVRRAILRARLTAQVASGDIDALETTVAAAEARYAALVDSQRPAETEPMAVDAVHAVDNSAWALMPASDWRPCPIGSLPDGRPTQLDLLVPVAA